MESTQEPELGERLNGIQSWPDLVVVKLSRAIIKVRPDSKTLDKIPELPQHVLREEASVAYWVGKVPADHVVGALHLLFYCCHRSRSTSPKDRASPSMARHAVLAAPPRAEVHRTVPPQVFRPATEQWTPPRCTTSDDNRTTQEPTNAPLFKTALLATPAPDLTCTVPRPEAARATLAAHVRPQAANRCGGMHGGSRARSEWMCVHPRQPVREHPWLVRLAPARTLRAAT